jgi:hypothetical protein
MKYDVELDDEPAELLRTLPIDLAICINEQLERLSEAPLDHGRKAHFPYRPVGMIYSFFCDSGDDTYYVVVFYHFEIGEQAIRVFAISTQRL